jgi:hypothetical protein
MIIGFNGQPFSRGTLTCAVAYTTGVYQQYSPPKAGIGVVSWTSSCIELLTYIFDIWI